MLLSACSSGSKIQQPPQQIIEYKKEKVICFDPPKNKPLELNDVVFVLSTDEEGIKVMGLHENEYKKLSQNTSRIETYILTGLAIIKYYQGCIDEHNKSAK